MTPQAVAREILGRSGSENRTGGLLEFDKQGKKHNFHVKAVISYGLSGDPLSDLVYSYGAPIETADFVVFPVFHRHWNLLFMHHSR